MFVCVCVCDTERECGCDVKTEELGRKKMKRIGKERSSMMCVCVFVCAQEGELLHLTVCGVKSGCVS